MINPRLQIGVPSGGVWADRTIYRYEFQKAARSTMRQSFSANTSSQKGGMNSPRDPGRSRQRMQTGRPAV